LGAVLAVSGVLALAACGSNSTGGTPNGPGAQNLKSTTNGEFGSLPAATGTPTHGGTITFGIINGSTPNFIFPMLTGASGSVYNQQFEDLFYEPLFNSEVSNRPVLDYTNSIGDAPQYTNGGKTVTINLKQNWQWSNGQPVVANDVVFFVDLLKAAVKEDPSNFGNYTPGNFPDNVTSITAPSKTQVVMHLTKAYNPSWFTETQLNVIYPLPSTFWNTDGKSKGLDFTNPDTAKSIYDYLIAQNKDLKSYGTNPLWQDVDGPYKLQTFNTTTDQNTSVPNPNYSGTPKANANFEEVYYASSTAQFNALRSGSLDVANIDSAEIPQVPVLKRAGYNVFGYPDLGFDYIPFNFKDTTNDWSSIIGQLYVRQALAHLQDEPGEIQGIYKGAAAQNYGSIPAVPQTPYVPSDAATDPYPFSISAASQLLSSHGWKVVPNGTTTCQSPGTGPSNCGAGIKSGDNLNITLPYTSDPPAAGQLVEALASNAKQVGINITPVSKTFNYLISNYYDSAAPQNINKWQAEDFGGFTEDIYPTTNDLFNTGGAYNLGDFSDPKLDSLIKASEFSSNPNALKTEASYVTTVLPGIFQPNEDRIWVWKNVSGDPDSFATLPGFGLAPNYWYVTSGS
jgi:peptide/nickel transport system substrate-binding protein